MLGPMFFLSFSSTPAGYQVKGGVSEGDFKFKLVTVGDSGVSWATEGAEDVFFFVFREQLGTAAKIRDLGRVGSGDFCKLVCSMICRRWSFSLMCS